MMQPSVRLRLILATIATLNLAYFGLEVVVALTIGSVALFADSIDFLEDAAINLLILAGLAWSARARSHLGMVLAGILLAPGFATLWMAARQFSLGSIPAPTALGLTGAGALLVNGTCALLLTRHRNSGGSLVRAAFLSARNDVIANLAIIVIAPISFLLQSRWPDLILGVAIGVLNAGAAWEVFEAARGERLNANEGSLS